MEDTVSIQRIFLGGKVGAADMGVFKVQDSTISTRKHTPTDTLLPHNTPHTHRFRLMGLGGVHPLDLGRKLPLRNER